MNDSRSDLDPMSTPTPETPAANEPSHRGLLAARSHAEPISRCIRCGKPTPAGVSLCEADNPGHIKAPSSTQVHGTMLLGVGIGILGFLLLAQLAVRHAGPFTGRITGNQLLASGRTQVELQISNAGAGDSIATCRVTRDGAPRADDLSIRTPSIPAGGTITMSHELPIPDAPPPYDPGSATLLCT